MLVDPLLLLVALGLSIFLVGFGLGMLYAEVRAAAAAQAAADAPPATADTPPPAVGALPLPQEPAPELGFLADDMARAATERWQAARAEAGMVVAEAPPTDDEVMIFDRVSLAISKLPLFPSHREYEVAERGVIASVAERYGLTAVQAAEMYRKVHAWKWRPAGERETTAA
jgi:hypothetical protein